MGKKGKWFSAVKRVFSPESKAKKEARLKKKLESGTSKPADSLERAASEVVPPPPPRHPEEDKVVEIENEQSRHACSAAVAAPAAIEPVVTSSEAAREIIRLKSTTKYPGKTTEEIAAIKIQTAFRGHLARRALRALRGLVRLKSLVDGDTVKRQATTTLRCMQTLARVQSQIRSRRIRMLEENQALQRQMLLKHERELESLKMGEEWDDSLQSKEQIEASLLSKQEAAIRRERALAYAFSHQQWKSSSKPVNPLFMDPNNLQWGWSWLERWMAARPWETRSTTDREPNDDRASIKSTMQSDGGGVILKAYACRNANPDKPSPSNQKPSRPASRQSPSTPPVKAPLLTGKMKSASPKRGWAPLEDDLRSMVSLQSERSRRHSLAAASVRDDESLAGSPAVPSYMAPTESARAKSRFQSLSDDTIESADRSSVVSAKKRLSFPTGERYSPASPAAVRRSSGPPKVDMALVKDVEVRS
uniref:DUF4005 domain-containing protein n=1 Tax=Musa acuminata subsp. malaccensis TaxID=214687 RepID=A0A804KVS3_MUSAM|nr:PREDICTED: protein IQ-DOMAIN 1 isoform X1 [Musa acuminata subsp. malaccensis]